MIRILTIFFVICSVAGNCYNAYAGSKDDAAFAVFESFCLSNLENPEKLKSDFIQLKIDTLPKNQAALFLEPHDGTAWLLKGSDFDNIVVTLTTKGVCGVYARDAVGQNVESLLNRYITSTKVDTKYNGSQIYAIYSIQYKDLKSSKQSNAMVVLSWSSLSLSLGASISSIPDSAFIK